MNAQNAADLSATFGFSSMKTRAMYRAYKKMIRRLGGGDIRVKDLKAYFRVHSQNNLATRCFRVLERAKCHRLEFPAFVLFCVNACANSETSLNNFAFSTYSHGKGFLTAEEVFSICEDAYNLNNVYKTSIVQNSKVFKRAKLKKKIASLCTRGSDGLPSITYENFLVFTKQNSLFLFPAFKLQQSIRSRVCGAPFWNGIKLVVSGATPLPGPTGSENTFVAVDAGSSR